MTRRPFYLDGTPVPREVDVIPQMDSGKPLAWRDSNSKWQEVVWTEVEPNNNSSATGPAPVLADGPKAGERDDEPLFKPLDLATLLTKPPEQEPFIVEPYIPARRRVWAFGAAESGKSMYAQWTASKLSQSEVTVAYFSSENPLDEDLRRLYRLRPNPEYLRFFHGSGLDLALEEHVGEFLRACEGASLVQVDTLTACWTGDEGDNAAIAQLDRDVLMPVIKDLGASIQVLHHTGHPNAFVSRKGAAAGRGASSMGQKADVVLNFTAKGGSDFAIAVGKMRAGNGYKPPERLYRVIDLEDDGLDVEALETTHDRTLKELKDKMVEAITKAEALSTNQLREAVGGNKDAQTEAMADLENEKPPRVQAVHGPFDTGNGRQHCKVWRLAGPSQEALK